MLSLTLFAWALAFFSQGQGTPSRDGRWVMIGIPMSYTFAGDSVQVRMYPPQAPLFRYKLDNNQIELDVGGGPKVKQNYAIRGDTLELTVPDQATHMLLRRIGVSSQPARIDGSWILRTAMRRPGSTSAEFSSQTMTYRSDGVFVMEVGPPAQARILGDTLEISAEGQSMRALLRFGRDTLFLTPLTDGAGGQQKFVRRPLGCFGIKDLDLSARECK